MWVGAKKLVWSCVYCQHEACFLTVQLTTLAVMTVQCTPVCMDTVFVDMLLSTGRSTVTITLNATGVTSGHVAIDLGVETGSTLPPATLVVGVHAIAAALGVDEGSVQGLAAGPDHQSVTFLLAHSAPVSSSTNQSGTSNSSKPLSDADIVGGLVVSLRPWTSLVTVQRSAGMLLEFGGSALCRSVAAMVARPRNWL